MGSPSSSSAPPPSLIRFDTTTTSPDPITTHVQFGSKIYEVIFKPPSNYEYDTSDKSKLESKIKELASQNLAILRDQSLLDDAQEIQTVISATTKMPGFSQEEKFSIKKTGSPSPTEHTPTLSPEQQTSCFNALKEIGQLHHDTRTTDLIPPPAPVPVVSSTAAGALAGAAVASTSTSTLPPAVKAAAGAAAATTTVGTEEKDRVSTIHVRGKKATAGATASSTATATASGTGVTATAALRSTSGSSPITVTNQIRHILFFDGNGTPVLYHSAAGVGSPLYIGPKLPDKTGHIERSSKAIAQAAVEIFPPEIREEITELTLIDFPKFIGFRTKSGLQRYELKEEEQNKLKAAANGLLPVIEALKQRSDRLCGLYINIQMGKPTEKEKMEEKVALLHATLHLAHDRHELQAKALSKTNVQTSKKIIQDNPMLSGKPIFKSDYSDGQNPLPFIHAYANQHAKVEDLPRPTWEPKSLKIKIGGKDTKVEETAQTQYANILPQLVKLLPIEAARNLQSISIDYASDSSTQILPFKIRYRCKGEESNEYTIDFSKVDLKDYPLIKDHLEETVYKSLAEIIKMTKSKGKSCTLSATVA